MTGSVVINPRSWEKSAVSVIHVRTACCVTKCLLVDDVNCPSRQKRPVWVRGRAIVEPDWCAMMDYSATVNAVTRFPGRVSVVGWVFLVLMIQNEEPL